MESLPRVGLIGAGVMGKGIGKNLLEKDFSLFLVSHKNRNNIDDLVSRGATEVATIAELVSVSDVIITCLPSIASVHSVFEGPDGLIENAAEGVVIIDCTTSDPELTRTLQAAAGKKGVHLVEAPLLGPPAKAWDGSISVALGGEPDDRAASLQVLEAFTGSIFEAGGPGSGHTIKLINNAVTLTNSAILYETFSVARKMGVDLDTLYKVLDTSMASSKRLHVIAPALINDEHEKRFAVDVATKDLVLYTTVAGESGVPIMVGEAAKAQIRLAQSLGYGDQNVTRIATALATIAGTRFGED